MAIVKKGTVLITGTIQNISFYTMQGHDKVIVRTKGGPTKSQIEKSASFAKLRQNNNEWKGCTLMASAIRNAMGEVKDLADFPVIGTLNGLAKKIQAVDTEHEQGQRSLCLSRCKELIGGLNVSRKQVFESVLPVPIDYTIDREKEQAIVTIPAIDTALFLHNSLSLPWFRIVMVLGAVSDLVALEEKKGYRETDWHAAGRRASVTTDWFPTSGIIAAQSHTLNLDAGAVPMTDSVTLIVSIGIEFGKTGTDEKPTGVKYAGCGKIAKTS
ncbi:MAG: hypothetical protein H6Q17_1727 [Bacteroidetes bacterium]|nr:hypothetical protein [Bacteroidota bacterium]